MIASAGRDMFLGSAAHVSWTVIATAGAQLRRNMAYLINIIRMPLWPLGMYAVAYLAYRAAGRGAVSGVDVSGFLLIGMVGQVMGLSAVWSSGSAIEEERYEGTIAALFLSPASRIAVVFGHGLGGTVFMLPSFAVVVLLGIVTGADLNIASPAAAVLSALALLVASLSLGFLLAVFFVLTRRANLMANVIQHPLYLLSGFIVPRGELPGWLATVSNALPLAHAVDAFRACTLTAATLNDVMPQLLGAVGTSVVCLALGTCGMQRMEHAAKRSGQLDLF